MSNLDGMKRAVILQKPSGTIAIGGNMDIRERKFYNAFLKVAEEILKKDPKQHIFTTTLTELKKALNVKEKDKNNATLKKIIRRMHEIDFEYNVLGKDKIIEGYASLIDNVKFVTDLRTGTITVSYSLPEDVRISMVKKNGIYASINLVVVKGLKSKYSVVLYELIRDYEKVEIPKMSITDFRKIFGVENKYKEMANLRRRVLEPAIKELNNNENIDFLVSYELIKQGKAYTHIKFHVKPKPTQIKLKQQAKKVLSEELKENTEAKELLAMIPPEYREKAKVVSVVLGGLKERGKDYTKAQIEYSVNKLKAGKVKDFVIYLKKAIEEDYAGFERVETDILTPEDAVGFSGYIYGKNGEKVVVRIGHVEKNEDGDYLVRLDKADTGELYEWWKKDEDWLLERAKRKKEMERSL